MNLAEVGLALFLTHGGSLGRWERKGILQRELAVYKELESRMRGITVVSYDPSDARYDMVLDPIDIVAFRQVRFQRLDRFIRVRRAAYALEAPVICKSNQLPGAMAAVETAKRIGGLGVVRCGYHYRANIERRYGKGSERAETARAMEERVFGAADAILLPTARLAEDIIQLYGVNPQWVHILPNYVDVKLFQPASELSDPQRICYVGRLSDEKNLLTLVEALTGFEVELHLVGEGPMEPALRRAAADHNVTVIFHGRLAHDQVPSALARSSLFVLPSEYEGHPKALIEAMAAGKTVLGTDVPGINDVIDHKENGWLCTPTVDGLREALGTLLSDPELREKLSTQAREDAVSRFSLDAIVKQELQIYDQLMDRMVT